MSEIEKKETPSKGNGNGALTLIGLALVAIISAGAVGGVLAKSLGDDTQAKIIVLRLADYVEAMKGEGKLTPSVADESILAMKRDAKDLAAKGYIVLKENAIIAAPEGSVLKP
jgi:ketopantoate reductase